MGAYDKNYLDDANDLSRLLFEEIAKKKEIDFRHFVKGYMSCLYRRLWDEGSARVMNMTFDELIFYLERYCPEIFVKGNYNIDFMQAGWIGIMYNRLQYELKISSERVYEMIDIEKMQAYFRTLHTVDEEVAFNKIISNIN